MPTVDDVFNELVPVGAHAAMFIRIGQIQAVAERTAGRLPGRRRADAFHAGRNRGIGERAEGGVDVLQVYQRVAAYAGGDARAGEDQRHARAVFIQALLAEQAMLPERQPVIAGQHEDGLVQHPPARHGGHDVADAGIQVGDHGVVVGQVAPHLFGRAREAGQHLIANMQLAIIEGMPAEEVRRQRELLGSSRIQSAPGIDLSSGCATAKAASARNRHSGIPSFR